MKKKIVWVIISLLWVIMILTPIVYYASKLKFPVICPGIVSKIITAILILLPVIFIVIAKVSKKENVVLSVFIICTVLNLVSIWVFTFGFTADVSFFYPVVSYTDSKENYLVIDENVLYAEDKVFAVFPDSIPNEAEDIDYEYYCEMSSNTVQIIARWTLPNEEYQLEKSRMSVGYKETSVYDYSSFAYNLTVEFDDTSNSVIYKCEQGDSMIVE